MESNCNIYEPSNPFEKIKLCGNVVGVKKYIFDIQGYIPLIINQSENNRPLVWVYAKSVSQKKIICIVNANKSNHEQVQCRDEGDLLVFNIKNPKNGEWVTFFKMIISKQYIPEVDELDLRPLGINIHGKNDELYIGEACLKNNIIVGSDVFLSL